MKQIGISLLFSFMSLAADAAPFDWSEGSPTPLDGRANPYALSPNEFSVARERGRLHTQIYPVTETGLLPPYGPLTRFFESTSDEPFRQSFRRLLQQGLKLGGVNDVFRWIGLHPYPESTDEGIYQVPYPNGARPETLMGVGLIERNGVPGFTLSCATCHSSHLFGKTVLGLTNRFPRANETFWLATKAAPFYNPHLFQRVTRATDAEMELMNESMANLKSVGVRRPQTLGLDTSLAQVALSLNKRNPDAFATKNAFFENRPRPDLLDRQPADSKPAVWWNLKYKNRWLSDGSVVSGNPIFTNILWNEIGRGADLNAIDRWLQQNSQIVKELTTAVFSTEAPRYSDFFDVRDFDLPRAQEGQRIFNQTCARCHGQYEKAWDLVGSEAWPMSERLRTVQVRYPEQTKVIDVGTDPLRHRGMVSLARLNELEISKRNETVIVPQKGYVPPPLVGIWARWPYFHNNSAPNLCAVLTRASERPQIYFSGAAKDRNFDFDDECNGYPTGSQTPMAWRTTEHRFDTRRAGLGNKGHDEGIFIKEGRELLTRDQKKSLIRFLQTL